MFGGGVRGPGIPGREYFQIISYCLNSHLGNGRLNYKIQFQEQRIWLFFHDFLIEFS